MPKTSNYIHGRNGKWKVASLFLLGGLSAGLLFGWITSTKTLRQAWFTKFEYWSVPTRPYWIIAGIAFLLGLSTSYVLATHLGWAGRSQSLLRQSLTVLLITASLPTALFVTPAIIHSLGPLGVMLVPCIIGLLVSIAMWVFTKEWYSSLVASMMLAGLLAITVANALSLLLPMSDESFDIIKLAIGYSSISAVCGYWLIKAQIHDSSKPVSIKD